VQNRNDNWWRKNVFVTWKSLPDSIIFYEVIDTTGTAAQVELEITREDAILTLIEKGQNRKNKRQTI
jgi:hypothetical protein